MQLAKRLAFWSLVVVIAATVIVLGAFGLAVDPLANG